MKTDNKDFEEFVSQTGFDPRRDIQQILFVSGGPGECTPEQWARAMLSSAPRPVRFRRGFGRDAALASDAASDHRSKGDCRRGA